MRRQVTIRQGRLERQSQAPTNAASLRGAGRGIPSVRFHTHDHHSRRTERTRPCWTPLATRAWLLLLRRGLTVMRCRG